MHLNASILFDKHASPLLPPGITVLEVGTGKKFWRSIYRKSAKDRGWTYRFCDMGNYGSDQEDFIPQKGPYEIVVPESYGFSAVIASQVVEHVAKPWVWIKELARVTKVGGLVVLVCPVTWAQHRHPVDCWRILPDGMRSLLEEGGLEVVKVAMENCDKTGGNAGNQFGGANVEVLDCIGVGRKK